VLVLRAGLFGRAPMSRGAIARRIGVSLRRVARLELSAVMRLGARGCTDARQASSGSSFLLSSTAGSDVAASRVAADVAGAQAREPDSGAVLGAHASHADLSLLHLSDDGGGTSGKALQLAAFMTVLLALILATAVAARRSGVPALLLARRGRRFEKPLLFLDVDGVIMLLPSPRSPPTGEAYDLGGFRTYIDVRCGEFLRELASRFELVWASGWESHANDYLRGVLELDRDLPFLRFGGKARWGSSDWKIRTIARAGGRRPIAWVDDTIGPAHKSWARERAAPTLLVKTDARTGISRRQVRRLCAWADSLERARREQASPSRTRRAA
jgi:hypothetical protein